MNNEYRPSVPIKWLIAPVISFLIIAMASRLTVNAGLGPSIGMLVFVVGVLTIVVTGVLEAFALAIAVTALVHAPQLRSTMNLAAVAIGASPFLLLAWFLLRGHM